MSREMRILFFYLICSRDAVRCLLGAVAGGVGAWELGLSTEYVLLLTDWRGSPPPLGVAGAPLDRRAVRRVGCVEKNTSSRLAPDAPGLSAWLLVPGSGCLKASALRRVGVLGTLSVYIRVQSAENGRVGQPWGAQPLALLH
jgi:hypothetical protein